MITHEWLEKVGFEWKENLCIYELYTAKRTFITAKEVNGEWHVGLEVTGATLGLSHIDGRVGIYNLHFALSGKQLGSN